MSQSPDHCCHQINPVIQCHLWLAPVKVKDQRSRVPLKSHVITSERSLVLSSIKDAIMHVTVSSRDLYTHNNN